MGEKRGGKRRRGEKGKKREKRNGNKKREIKWNAICNHTGLGLASAAAQAGLDSL